MLKTIPAVTARTTRGNSYGYVAGRRVATFGDDSQGSKEQHAARWRLATLRAVLLETLGDDLARLQRAAYPEVVEVKLPDAAAAGELVLLARDRHLPAIVTPREGRVSGERWWHVALRPAEIDLEVTGIGESVLQFHGRSDAGEEWLQALNSESWQWLGGALAVEHRVAGGLIERAAADGLRVRVQ